MGLILLHEDGQERGRLFAESSDEISNRLPGLVDLTSHLESDFLQEVEDGRQLKRCLGGPDLANIVANTLRQLSKRRGYQSRA